MPKETGDEQDDVSEGSSLAAKEARLAKGRLGEQKLDEWFKAQQLSYVAICQDVASFTPLFRNAIKRPDFLTPIEGVDLIAIGAKNQSFTTQNEFTLTLSAELRRAIAFERLFRMPLWYAIRNCERDDSPWYWINSLKVVEVGVKRMNTQAIEYMAIKLDEFECISTAADLSKLYNHRSPGYRQLVKNSTPDANSHAAWCAHNRVHLWPPSSVVAAIFALAAFDAPLTPATRRIPQSRDSKKLIRIKNQSIGRIA